MAADDSIAESERNRSANTCVKEARLLGYNALMLYASPLITVYVLVVAALLGLVMGSFINCWAWRYMNGESVMRGRSHCTSCGHDLGVRDLVPVFSWLATRGTCRYCGEKVSARYPATEVVCALAFAAIVAMHGLSLETVELLAFAGILLFLSLTDLDDYLIPNGCIIAALAVRAVYLAVAFALGQIDLPTIGYYVLSAFGMGLALVIIVLVADKVFGRDSMGGGDLKLFFVAGLYFGWQQGLFLVIVSCVIGIVGGALFSRNQGETPDGVPDNEGQTALRRAFPFGPAIAVACVITMLIGEPLISWYLSLL